MSNPVTKAENQMRRFLRTYRKPDPEPWEKKVVIDLNGMSEDETWAFVERVMALGRRLGAEGTGG